MRSEEESDPEQNKAGASGLAGLPSTHQERLRAIERRLRRRRLPEAFIRSALRATQEAMRFLEADAASTNDTFQREEVRRFMAETGAQPAARVREPIEKETRRIERERILGIIQGLIREARTAHAYHEVKKTRNRLLKIDQRRLRRELGRDGEELCREINAILRA
ncbi:MAG: hypothetical protein HY320_16005 [Armatimonadetes bacterium]|nr:hypothetical protein [Armatimonadota bacterium]